MFIEEFKNNGIAYLRLMHGRRVVGTEGRKTIKKDTILNIGPLSRFDDGKPDYIGRLRESFRQGQPLIDSLREYAGDTDTSAKTYTVHFQANSDDCIGHPKHCSHFLLDKVFTGLGLSQYFTALKFNSKIEYDLVGLVRLLVFGRILKPASKLSTFAQNDGYYGGVTSRANKFNVYDALDVINENKNGIMRRMNAAITKNLRRNPDIVFYDVTNFFFEIEEADGDYEEGGEIKKGLRQKGVSKEHRNQPIVQMGLFMDDMGLPISIEMFPGNTLDQATLRPALKSTIDTFDFKRFILVADRGLCSYKNALRLMGNGNGYIVSKSIKKTGKAEREWILGADGYSSVGEDFRYKSRVRARTERDEDGNECAWDEQVVVYWSKRFYERERREHQTFLVFLEKLKASPSSFRVSAAEKKSIKRFFKKEVVNEDTGEMLNSGKLLAMLDESKVEQFTAYMGYYQIVTSEVGMPPLEVIDKYHGLSRIEDQFRVMKGDLDTRPVFVRSKNHIYAHLLVCFIALTIVRLIQRRILDSGLVSVPGDKHWTSGLTGARIQDALNKWQVDSLPDSFFRFNHSDDHDLDIILRAYGIVLPSKLFSAGEIKGIKSQISPFGV